MSDIISKKMNMVEIARENQSGADIILQEKKRLLKNSYKTVIWQHNSEWLCYAIWADNNIRCHTSLWCYISYYDQINNYFTPAISNKVFYKTNQNPLVDNQSIFSLATSANHCSS